MYVMGCGEGGMEGGERVISGPSRWDRPGSIRVEGRDRGCRKSSQKRWERTPGVTEADSMEDAGGRIPPHGPTERGAEGTTVGDAENREHGTIRMEEWTQETSLIRSLVLEENPPDNCRRGCRGVGQRGDGRMRANVWEWWP